jgi:plastocyanin domain-containing protein
MNAQSSGYTPNSFKVKVGVPVRWEITDTGTSGCTNAVVSKGLFDGQIDLKPGQTSVKEFTPVKAGKYKFSCWMGMITGSIEVVDPSQTNNTNNPSVVQAAQPTEIPSGAKGCGCGGGGSGAN